MRTPPSRERRRLDAEQVTVRLTVANGVVRSIEYAASLGGGIVTIATAISDVGAVEPIPSP